MSFNPLYEQIEFECAGAPVRLPEPEPATPGVPGGPCTSPARAAPAPTAENAATHSSVTKRDFNRILPPPLLTVRATLTSKCMDSAFDFLNRTPVQAASRLVESGLEGVVAKRLRDLYRPGARRHHPCRTAEVLDVGVGQPEVPLSGLGGADQCVRSQPCVSVRSPEVGRLSKPMITLP